MGRFLLGFGIGIGIGIAAVILSSPRTSSSRREGAKALVDGALEAARLAAAAREQEMWIDFRTRLSSKQQAKNP